MELTANFPGVKYSNGKRRVVAEWTGQTDILMPPLVFVKL